MKFGAVLIFDKKELEEIEVALSLRFAGLVKRRIAADEFAEELRVNELARRKVVDALRSMTDAGASS